MNQTETIPPAKYILDTFDPVLLGPAARETS